MARGITGWDGGDENAEPKRTVGYSAVQDSMRIIELENRCTGNRTVGSNPTLSGPMVVLPTSRAGHDTARPPVRGALIRSRREAPGMEVAQRVTGVMVLWCDGRLSSPRFRHFAAARGRVRL